MPYDPFFHVLAHLITCHPSLVELLSCGYGPFVCALGFYNGCDDMWQKIINNGKSHLNILGVIGNLAKNWFYGMLR